MFSFVLVSHPSCAVFRCFALYSAPVLSVLVCVFPYWVRPLVMLLTFTASAFGCIPLCAPFRRLTRPSRRSLRGKLKKKIILQCFCSVRPSSASPDPRVSPLGGDSTSVHGGRDFAVRLHKTIIPLQRMTRFLLKKPWSFFCVLVNFRPAGEKCFLGTLQKHYIQ